MSKDELNLIIQEGESYTVELKESLDKTIADEVCAFANASGGRIIIGVNDEGVIVGTDCSNAQRSRIQDTISKIQPTVVSKLSIVENTIVIDIAQGTEKPYSSPRGFFLRVGPNSQKLERYQIIEFFQSEGRYRFDELLCESADFEAEIDRLAVKEFLLNANINTSLDIGDVLANLVCARSIDGSMKFTNAGVLCFARSPQIIFPQSTVFCALYKVNDKVNVFDRKDLEGNVFNLIESALIFLKKHLRLNYSITSSKRLEYYEIPVEALREAVINAVCHRDYFERGARVMVEVFDDRVEISNPGALPKNLSLSDFGKRSVARNPVLASVLHRARYIEQMGTGISRMRSACKNASIPEPVFAAEGFFSVVFLRTVIVARKEAVDGGKEAVDGGKEAIDGGKEAIDGGKEAVDGGKESIWGIGRDHQIVETIKSNPHITLKEISIRLDVSLRSVERTLVKLRQQGIIMRDGPTNGGRWVVNISKTMQD